MTTKTDAARMRATVARVMATHSKGTLFPAQSRDEVMAFARQRRADGMKLRTLSAEIGMSYWTLWEWFRAERRQQQPGKRREPRATMVPVHIVPARPAPRSMLTIHGPCGIRIEGDVDTIAALVRSLA